MSGNGRGGNNRRRNFKYRGRAREETAPDYSPGQENPHNQGKKKNEKFKAEGTPRGEAASGTPRPADPRRARGRNWTPDSADRARGSRNQTPKNTYDRPKWQPVKLPSTPLPSPDCPVCGKPIKDISIAFTDKASGSPVHFDCALEKVSEHEAREQGDIISYIGGGRFGIVYYNNSQDLKNFQIKKIIEWEDKENRADWRKNIADHFSVT
jgi:hypothetical protein